MPKHLEDTTITQLLRVRSPIFISKYQRGYAWESEQVDDFISDIKNLRQNRREHGDKKHFFGSIVTVNVFNPRDNDSYSVVDGQQRLTTVTLAVACLVNAMNRLAAIAEREKETDLAKSIRLQVTYTKQEFLYYNRVSDTDMETVLRLSLSKIDQQFFADLIEKLTQTRSITLNPTTESNKRLRAAANKITKELFDPVVNSSESVEKRFEELKALRTILTSDIEVVHIISNDRSEAYRLFSTLNDRGEELTEGDLLRSRTLEVLEPYTSMQDPVEKAWDEIFSKHSQQIEKFLRVYFASVTGKRASKREMFDDYQKELLKISGEKSSPEQANRVKRFVEQMQREIPVYAKLSNGDWPYSERKARAWDQQRLDALMKILRHDLALPLLLSASVNLTEDDFVKIVGTLEKVVFRYITIGRQHAGKLQDVYYEHAKLIRDNPDSYSVQDLNDTLKELLTSVSDDLFKLSLVKELTYSESSPKNRQIKYFLTTLESYRFSMSGSQLISSGPNKSVSYNFDQNDVEHIYPRNPVPSEKIESLTEYTNKLGNLSFWNPDENKAASNGNFILKRQAYQASTSKMNQELAALGVWDEAAYMHRQEKMLEAACQIYTL